jgi:hypothetical protein
MSPRSPERFRQVFERLRGQINQQERIRDMAWRLRTVDSTVRLKRAQGLFILSLTWCIASMSLLLVTKILPPSDEVCDQNNIIFSPLQASIEYKWINYGDMWAQGSQYRTSFNTSISDETDKAWLGLLTGRRRLLCRPRLND